MIEKLATSHDNVLELRIAGVVSEEDYKKVLIPALDEAIEAHERIRALIRLESDLKEFTLGAMMQDGKLGLKHWNGFDRVAVVADDSVMTKTIRAFSVMYPCPVMVFPLDDEDGARRWLTESLGAIHQTDLGDDVLHVQLLGKLDAAVYEEEERDLNAFIHNHDRFKLLLDLREFDGWQGLGAVGRHLAVVRDHRDLVDRMAIVGDNGFAKMAKRLSKSFVKAEAKYFDADEFDEAKRWIAA